MARRLNSRKKMGSRTSSSSVRFSIRWRPLSSLKSPGIVLKHPRSNRSGEMTTSLFRSSAWLCVLAMLMGSGIAAAQSNTGRISGTVADSSGGILPGVTVTVTEDRTAYTQSAVTDERGAYVIVSLPIGTYTVTSELPGFKKEVKSGYNLVADGRVTVDFALSVGAVEEVITVTSQAGETVNTVSGEVARVIDREQVQNLALNGRNYMQLASLIP